MDSPFTTIRNEAQAMFNEIEQLLDERESLLTLCIHHDGRNWWVIDSINVPPGACATEFTTNWQSFESRDEACKAAIANGFKLRMAQSE